MPLCRIVLIGSVDAGKSTLIGRLLHDAGALPEGRVAQLAEAAARRGQPFEFANLTDGLQAERDQNVTIDTTEIALRHPGGDVTFIDAPGHLSFLRNMVTGASRADAALLVVDVNEGVTDQTRRHAFLLTLLGITRVVIALNKIDRLDPPHAEARSREVTSAIQELLSSLNLTCQAVVPVSAREGTNLPVLLTELESLSGRRRGPLGPRAAAVLPVQDVYRADSQRVIVGRNEGAGPIANSPIVVLPLGERGTLDEGPGTASFVLREPLFVSRGDVIASPDAGLASATTLHARLFWLGREPLSSSRRYEIRIATQRADAEVAAIQRVVDSGTLTEREDRSRVPSHDVADVEFKLSRPMVVDTGRPASGEGRPGLEGRHRSTQLSRFVIVDDADIAGGGVILSSTPVLPTRQSPSRSFQRVTPEERVARAGHGGAIVWLTGLSGAGKSTLAEGLERALFDRGRHVLVLDGDRVRFGLNADLGFSPADRAENIRRVAEVAKLFAESGAIVITAFISPYAADRAHARAVAASGGVRFLEVFVDADLATCEARDPKGLYRKARAGEIAEFTGVSAPYEAPASADVRIRTAGRAVEECVTELSDWFFNNQSSISVSR